MKEALGYVGMVLLGACALPLVAATVHDGHANGVDPLFLAMWLGGEVAMLWHILLTTSTLPVRLNYIANVGLVGIVGFYKWLL